MRTSQDLQHRTAARRLLVALLTLFLLAQTLGWVHRGLHGSERRMPGSARSHVSTACDAASSCAAQADPGWAQRLFGSHEDAAQCQLYDAVTHPGCTPGAVTALGLVPVAAAWVRTEAAFVARRTALFDARGPPPFRS